MIDLSGSLREGSLGGETPKIGLLSASDRSSQCVHAQSTKVLHCCRIPAIMHSCWSWPFSIVVIVAAAAAAAGVLASDDSARDDTIDLDLRRGTRRQLVDDWSPVSHRHEICVQKSPPLVLSVLLSKLSNVSATEADGCHVLCTLTLKGYGRAPTIKLKLVIRASGPMDAQVKIRRHIFGLTFRPGTGMLSQAGSWAVASSIESLIRFVARRERNMTNARRVRLVGKGFPGRARDVDRRTAALPEVARRGFSGDDRGAAVHAHDYQGRTPLHLAADNGRTQVVKRLLAPGAENNAVDRQARTARQLPAESGRYDVVDVLNQHGAAVDHRRCRPRANVTLGETDCPPRCNDTRQRQRRLPTAVSDAPGRVPERDSQTFRDPDASNGPESSASDEGYPGNRPDDMGSKVTKWPSWATILVSSTVLADHAWARYWPSPPVTGPAMRRDHGALVTGASLVAGAAVGIIARRVHRRLTSPARQHRPHHQQRRTMAMPVPWGAIAVGLIALAAICILIYRFRPDDRACFGLCIRLRHIGIAWYRFRVMIGRPPRSRACRFRS